MNSKLQRILLNFLCPICYKAEVKIIGYPKINSISINFIDREYKIVQCNNCLIYFVLPQINFTDEEWTQLYNSEYFIHQSKWLIKQRAKELRQRFDKAAGYLQNKRDIQLLDVGTGEGKALVEGKQRGWDVTGIDIVDNRIDYAKDCGIKFICAKFLEYELPDNSFDFVYFDSVLEHVLDPAAYLIKIKKVLRPGGIVYIGVPNEDSLFNSIRRLVFNLTGRKQLSEKLKPFDSPYHVTGFNIQSLEFIIKRTGLEIKYFRNFGRKMDFLSYSILTKGFWISLLFLFPIEMIGYIIKKDVYLESYLIKTN